MIQNFVPTVLRSYLPSLERITIEPSFLERRQQISVLHVLDLYLTLDLLHDKPCSVQQLGGGSRG